jgi:hypothetical protein
MVYDAVFGAANGHANLRLRDTDLRLLNPEPRTLNPEP